MLKILGCLEAYRAEGASHAFFEQSGGMVLALAPTHCSWMAADVILL